jgi:ubiquitin-like protein Pup
MSQEQVQKQKSKTRADESHIDESSTDVTNEELAQKTDETLENIDDVLDAQLDEELLADMDDILEQNAEEFVQGYVQQGGE